MTRTLLRGASVVSLASDRADAERLDILVDEGRIVALDRDIAAGGAETVDLTGRILMPGFVNAHLHSWQSALRGMGADWTLLDYLATMHGGLAGRYGPEDMAIATFASALNQISCGTTTLGDWCHNAATTAHAEAAVDALHRAKIRAVFFHGLPHSSKETPHPTGEIDHLQRLLSSREGLVGLGMAIRGPQYASGDVASADFRAAQERGLVVSMHQSGGRPGAAWHAVHDAGLIGPRTNIVHGHGLTDDWIARLIDAGATFTLTPENEMGQGHGWPVTDALLRHGGAPSLGTDVDTVLGGEVLVQARIALAHQRATAHARHRKNTGLFSPSTQVSSRQALEWCTIEGARALGLDHVVGTLEIGKQADIVAIDARQLNLWPANDPLAAVLHSGLSNVEAVMIAGRWCKRDHRLVEVDLDAVKATLARSGERLSMIARQPGLIPRLRRGVVRHVVHGRLRAEAEK